MLCACDVMHVNCKIYLRIMRVQTANITPLQYTNFASPIHHNNMYPAMGFQNSLVYPKDTPPWQKYTAGVPTDHLSLLHLVSPLIGLSHYPVKMLMVKMALSKRVNMPRVILPLSSFCLIRVRLR